MISAIPVADLRTAVAEWREARNVLARLSDPTSTALPCEIEVAAVYADTVGDRLADLITPHLEDLVLAAELAQQHLEDLRKFKHEEPVATDAADDSAWHRAPVVDPVAAELERVAAMPRPDGDTE